VETNLALVKHSDNFIAEIIVRADTVYCHGELFVLFYIFFERFRAAFFDNLKRIWAKQAIFSQNKKIQNKMRASTVG
jgi:hypothetical protein